MHRTLFRKVFTIGISFVFSIIFTPIIVNAQDIDPSTISNSQAVEYYKKAKASGMSDMDIEQAALQKGYTLDQISAMRKKLQQTPTLIAPATVGKTVIDETRKNNDTATVNKKIASVKKDATSKPTFGSNFFENAAMTFEPNLRIATPRNYILGPEDELVVDIYGNSVDNFRLKISPEGTVKMLNLAPVQVSGLTIEQASERIVNRLRQAYSSLNRPGGGTYSTITLGNVRSIHVMVTGEVTRPGSYTMSSLSTAFNALYQAGGPNSNGSYRNIEIIRNNKTIRSIDLYRFLVDANLQDNIALQDQDIILIRPFLARVELSGEVKRPGLFEAKDGDSFDDLLRYAGGYTPVAYSSSIQFRRNTGSELKVGTIQGTNVKSFIPQNGDVYQIGKILDRIENRVIIEGAVFREGEYAIDEQSNTVKKLIERAAGIREDAFLNRALIQRQSKTLRPELIAFDLEKMLSGQIEDIPLQREDIVTIKSIDDLKEGYSLQVYGSVISPGTQDYYDGITISDVIFKAGGYAEGAIPYRIEVSRRVKEDTVGLTASQNVRIFTIDVAEDLKITTRDQQFKLQPSDIIYIRKSPRYEVQKTISVLGEVNYPGTYTIVSNHERINNLFQKAGGLKDGAYLHGSRFFRRGELVAVDLDAIIKNPSHASNLLLIDGDSLYIPRKSETVRIQGGVQNPSLVNFDPSFTYKDYISQAGGYGENAWKNRVYVSYPNGRTFRTKKYLVFTTRPTLEPGSIITVPIKEEKQDRQTAPGERIALISLLTTMAVAVISLFK
ncbi:SLBB domain-containing protein [Dyadobacter psychrotolerans]|uniref:Polysaccharide export protein n=1 Tax=Dyadobacter psychrotolerans TaxID=2541721 RepID=A0A4R5DGJ6_9BACT|nr:SLBB domain-containing protein [Dyadobacter psychrotolerans]TDE13142.1 polysaccharide export protein [Dyadobacter psychrotolerans]